MSYLFLPQAIPDFSKAIISFWFRVPKASLANIITGAETNPYYDNMDDVLPLVNLGSKLTGRVLRAEWSEISVAMNFSEEHYRQYDITSYVDDVEEQQINPTYIGIKAVRDPETDAITPFFTLVIHLQTSLHASITNFNNHFTRVEQWATGGHPWPPPDFVAFPYPLGSGWRGAAYPFPGVDHWFGFADLSFSANAQPEYFLVESPKQLAADHWHHLLLSFDIGGGCKTHGPPQPRNGSTASHATTSEGTDEHCRLWCAIDDVNCDGKDNLGPYFVDGGDDLNAILSRNAWDVANSGTGLSQNLFEPVSTCQFGPAFLAIDAGGLAIPAEARFVNHIRQVEMAEFQFFRDISLDTGKEGNRRLFVDTKGKPVKPGIAEKVLGKRPAVLLHGTSKWIKGQNTGSLGLDVDGKPIPTGQFKRTGFVKRYRPDPSLHGQQSPRAGPVQLTRSAADARL